MFISKMNIENEFLAYISEAIQEKYDVSSSVADNIVRNSQISKMIYSSPDFVIHYDVEDWADELMSNVMAR